MSFRIFFRLSLILFIGTPLVGSATSYNWRIMPLGNSITVGVHGSDPIGGYRDDLQVILQNNGYSYNFIGSHRDGDPALFDVDHQGTGGIRADEVLAQIDDWLNANPPDVILVHIGTNDISNGDDVTSTVDEISQILDHIYNFDIKIKILLASIVPRNDSKNVFTDDLNHEIRNLVTAKQNENYLIYYVPINEAFKENANWDIEYLDDSVHPNNQGYSIMAQEWYEIFAAVIDGGSPPPPPPVQPDSMYIISGNGQSGGVHTILPTPLIVQVVDENDDPAFDVQLHFGSKIGNGAVQTDGSGKTQFIEAESAVINSPCKIVGDFSTSNNAYVVSEVRKSGDFSLTVNIIKEADYYFWGRVFAPSIDEDSFFLVVDNKPDTILWDLWEHENWYWEEVEDRDLGRRSFHFTPGKHLLKFITREDHSRLDKIVVTDDPDFIPQGIYGFPDIYTDQHGKAQVYWLLGNELGIQKIKVTSPALAEQSLLFEASAFADENQIVNLSGNISYYSDAQAIPNIDVMLNTTHIVTSDNSGDFIFPSMQAGENYTIKTDSNFVAENAAHAIISYDAALTSRYAVGLENLTPDQILAADADNDGQVLTYDASLIARFVVGLDPVGNSKVGDWIFNPSRYEYVNLDSSVSNANFTGIVRGDVHGGWQPAALAKRPLVETSLLQDTYAILGDTVVFEIPIQATEKIFSFDFDLSFQRNALELIKLDLSQLNLEFQVFENRDFDRIRIGGFTPNGSRQKSKIILKYLMKSESSANIKINLFRINNNSAEKSSVYLNLDNRNPNQFVLFKNYPNPFNQETVFSFHLPQPDQITLQVFNSIGQEVWSLVRTYETSGPKLVRFFGKDRFGVDLQSGNYYLRIQTGDGKSFNQKLSIVR